MHAWQALILTAAFGLIGTYNLVFRKTEKSLAPAPEAGYSVDRRTDTVPQGKPEAPKGAPVKETTEDQQVAPPARPAIKRNNLAGKCLSFFDSWWYLASVVVIGAFGLYAALHA